MERLHQQAGGVRAGEPEAGVAGDLLRHSALGTLRQGRQRVVALQGNEGEDGGALDVAQAPVLAEDDRDGTLMQLDIASGRRFAAQQQVPRDRQDIGEVGFARQRCGHALARGEQFGGEAVRLDLLLQMPAGGRRLARPLQGEVARAASEPAAIVRLVVNTEKVAEFVGDGEAPAARIGARMHGDHARVAVLVIDERPFERGLDIVDVDDAERAGDGLDGNRADALSDLPMHGGGDRGRIGPRLLDRHAVERRERGDQ